VHHHLSKLQENLAVGKLAATDDEIRAAAARAQVGSALPFSLLPLLAPSPSPAPPVQALAFIERSEDGFDTEIGERGRALSGGERQRLSIARAVLRDAPILILDEATSALDSHTEALLTRALDDLTQQRTTLIIAHRLSTVRKADQIIVMDRGAVAEQGTFQELYAAGGLFTQLVESQMWAPESAADAVAPAIPAATPTAAGDARIPATAAAAAVPAAAHTATTPT